MSRLVDELDRERRNHAEELADNDRLLQALRNKMDETTNLGREENESLKVHMAVLREKDLTSLKDYY